MSDRFFDKYRIETTRKPNWDYSSSGWYFVTICTYDRICWFGDVYDKEMHLNELGNIAQQCWLDIPKHFPNIKLGEFVIMPNHVHGIITINQTPDVETCHGMSLPMFGKLPPKSLGSIINQFKGSVKRSANQNNGSFQWQSNYHDRIIRNEFEYSAKVEYILNNPAKWDEDENNLTNIKNNKNS